jgi:hypothetical protein
MLMIMIFQVGIIFLLKMYFGYICFNHLEKIKWKFKINEKNINVNIMF